MRTIGDRKGRNRKKQEGTGRKRAETDEIKDGRKGKRAEEDGR